MSRRDRASLLLIVAALAALAYAVAKPATPLHPVTAPMRASAAAQSGRRLAIPSAPGSDGRSHSPLSESADRPLVLIFIKDGCPCSESAEPYFRRLQLAYAPRATFLGVIDSDLPTARSWVARHATPYPVLADPDLRIITPCAAERSAYVLLLAPGGTVSSLWPGFSAPMLAEVGSHIARLTGQEPAPLDATGAPAELASGCSF